MKKQTLFLVLLVIAIVLTLMSWHYFGSDDAGILRGKPMAVKSWLPLWLRIHIGGGMLALLFGAVLVVSSSGAGLRLHRVLGWGYTMMVFISGIAGLVVAPHAIGGLISAAGLASLSFTWMFTTVLAAQSASKGEWQQHRKYTTYSLALTFSSLTFRLVLLLAFLGIPFVTVYRASCWVSWLFHLGVAAWWLSRSTSSTHRIIKTTTA